MKKKTKTVFLGLSALAVVGVLAMVIFHAITGSESGREKGRTGIPEKQDYHLGEPVAANAEKEGMRAPDAPQTPVDEIGTAEMMEADLTAYIRDRFGNTIFHGHTQIKAIEKIAAQLMKLYPDDWEERMQEFLKGAFPDLADELYEKFSRLTEYNEWLRNNRSDVIKMSPGERRDALWDIRYQIFGEEAYVIWEAELRSEQIIDSLDQIAEARDTGIDEKLDTYLNSVKTAYGDMADQFIQKRQTELMNKFLSVESVQENLHALPGEERKEKLVTLRRAMGMDADALKRWDELDSIRDRSWDAGQQYLNQRNKIIGEYTGDEQQTKIAELREKLFGAETAGIIKDEEEAGFNRFDHKRVYGKE